MTNNIQTATPTEPGLYWYTAPGQEYPQDVCVLASSTNDLMARIDDRWKSPKRLPGEWGECLFSGKDFEAYKDTLHCSLLVLSLSIWDLWQEIREQFLSIFYKRNKGERR